MQLCRNFSLFSASSRFWHGYPQVRVAFSEACNASLAFDMQFVQQWRHWMLSSGCVLGSGLYEWDPAKLVVADFRRSPLGIFVWGAAAESVAAMVFREIDRWGVAHHLDWWNFKAIDASETAGSGYPGGCSQIALISSAASLMARHRKWRLALARRCAANWGLSHGSSAWSCDLPSELGYEDSKI